ncbi:MAG: hypothetical protein IPO78_12355 [Saprospiraceae bacterium]|nr:hypothetical protein [Saprospiraceae bacterium]MBK8483252.1 hypothetical protein [Saprospiraceae bacterium]MBK9220765.1 hypothetical protein [Saprospiraceae bacterium]MBK9722390.1 hypothetical protein [Saprospiraceae bacterium]MBK9729414.1 hypothetical protein [Saprospiraceae bacterium]
MRYQFLFLFVFILSLNSCFYDSEETLYPNPPACDTMEVSYNLDVSPILQSRCYNCHGNNNTVSIYEFEGYTDFLNFIALNRFLGSINHESGFTAMPLGGEKIPNCEIKILEAWINQGTLNN